MSKAYDIVTDRILDLLDSGVAPWRQPWNVPAGTLPQNAFSRRPYRGINNVLLGLMPYSDHRWLTFKQAREHGGHVRKSEKATPIVFWKDYEVEVEDEEQGTITKRVPLLRFHHVFNVQQCDGLDLPPMTKGDAPAPIEAAETIVRRMPNAPSMAHDGGVRAFYRPATDSVHIPPRSAFQRAEDLYAVLFHELGHSTGHTSRLDRGLGQYVAPFGSEDYSREELVAEFCSAFLCHEAGITNDLPNTASYIASWVQVIRNDRRMVVVAASRAQKAADYILARQGEVR